MISIEEIGRLVGSRRYARDLLDTSKVTTSPWWDREYQVLQHDPSGCLLLNHKQTLLKVTK